ncbi:MAG: class I SAM-dependent methyltransferase [Thermoleophilaceae bacterium]
MSPAAEDPLRTSLFEQLARMRGSESLPGPLLDIVSETFESGEERLIFIRPRDWDELRHQEGAEGRSTPYWALAWPSGRALAETVAARELNGRRVLELGCGLALPSLAAARRGADVLATDGSPDAVVFAAHNLALNELEGEVAQADWREAGELLYGGPWDLVLAADVLYLRHNVEALLRVLPGLLGREGEALIADPNRAGGRDFAAAARRMFRLESRPDAEREKMTLHRLRPR